MSKILIANIGNRTLIAKNHNNKPIGAESFIAPNGEAITGSFKEITKQILDNQWFDSVFINIIDKLLDKYINEIEKVYLFVSNQEGNYTKQDTLYAGQILKNIIPPIYNIKEENINIIEIQSEIIKADELIPEYRKALLKIKGENLENQFVFCDSGGTPQQKTAMKIVAEYLLKHDEYEYKQVVQKADYNDTFNFENAEVKTINSVEYQKVINDENIILLCHNGDYQGAKTLRKAAYNDKDKIFKALSFLDLRLNRLKARAKSYANELQHLKSLTSIKNYLDGTPVGNYSNWENDFERADFFDLCEILSIAQYQWNLGNLADAVLNYQIFIENYCIFFIKKKKGSSFDLNGLNRRVALTNIKNDLVSNFTKVQPHIPHYWERNKIVVSLPTEIVYCERVLNGQANHQVVIATFKCLHGDLRSSSNEGLDDLRNDIAHNGIGIIDVSQINNYVEGGNFQEIVNNWNTLFGLPNINIYEQSNREIEKFLRDN